MFLIIFLHNRILKNEGIMYRLAFGILLIIHLSGEELSAGIALNNHHEQDREELLTVLPEKGPYLSCVTQNSIIISWHTAALDSSLIQYGLTADCEYELKDITLKTAHSLKLSSLLPDTTYYYRILFGDLITQTYTFRTAASFGKGFKFTVIGDTRTQADSHLAVINRLIEQNPYFSLHSGDLVEDGFDEAQWTTYFAIICSSATCAPKIPFYYAIGNHENESPLYYNYFYLPHNNPDSVESFYSFDYGNSHFISIDTEIPYGPSSNQYRWLRNDLLSAYDKTYIFVFIHNHPYCAGGHNSDLDLRDALSPVFESFKVDMVLSGHSHFYQRNGPINGVTYIITAGGGAPLHTPAESSWTVYTEKSHHLVQFIIYPDSARFQMIRTDGSTGDDFVYFSRERSKLFFGDANGDTSISVSDVVYIINYLFKSGSAPAGGVLIGDVDCDGDVLISDIIYLINYLFKSGPSPGC